MKRLLTLTGISLAALAVMLGVMPQSASALPPATRVTGVIYQDSTMTTPVADAEVSVMCEGATQTDTTDASGTYLVSFDAADCPAGMYAHIKVKKGGLSGDSLGEVKSKTTKLNVVVVNAALPEYGPIAGVLTVGAAAGMIIFARRRAQQHSQVQA